LSFMHQKKHRLRVAKCDFPKRFPKISKDSLLSRLPENHELIARFRGWDEFGVAPGDVGSESRFVNLNVLLFGGH
jgi:hypothetical protein